MELFTIGHSNHPINVFIDLLKSADIKLVMDVREKPNSRWPQFGTPALAHHLSTAGIDYRWMGRILGGMTAMPTTHVNFVDKMEQVVRLGSADRSALMCSEGKPCDCHRAGKLTAWLHRQRPEVVCTHIMPDGSRINARDYEPKVKATVWCEEFAR